MVCSPGCREPPGSDQYLLTIYSYSGSRGTAHCSTENRYLPLLRSGSGGRHSIHRSRKPHYPVPARHRTTLSPMAFSVFGLPAPFSLYIHSTAAVGVVGSVGNSALRVVQAAVGNSALRVVQVGCGQPGGKPLWAWPQAVHRRRQTRHCPQCSDFFSYAPTAASALPVSAPPSAPVALLPFRCTTSSLPRSVNSHNQTGP